MHVERTLYKPIMKAEIQQASKAIRTTASRFHLRRHDKYVHRRWQDPSRQEITKRMGSNALEIIGHLIKQSSGVFLQVILALRALLKGFEIGEQTNRLVINEAQWASSP